MASLSEDSRPQILDARDASRVVMEEMRHLQQERLVALLLDNRSQLIRKVTISVGTLTGSPAHPRGLQRGRHPQRGEHLAST